MTELGNRLKEARLEKGMSIEDLQTATKIQKRYLIGIEEGNYSMMPGPFYVRAFIRQYAEAVDLNPEELFEQYKSEIPSTYKDDIPEKLSRVQSRQNIPVKNSKFLDMLPRILIIAFVLGALLLLWYLFSKYTSDEPGPEDTPGDDQIRFEQSDDLINEPEDEGEEKDTDSDSDKNDEGNKDNEDGESENGKEDEDEKEPEQPEQEITVVESAGKNTTYEVKNADKVELKIVSTGETWISLVNDQNKSFFRGMLVKGGEQESTTADFTNETVANIVVGNSANTDIYINDQILEYEISPKDQVRQDITIRFVKDSE